MQYQKIMFQVWNDHKKATSSLFQHSINVKSKLFVRVICAYMQDLQTKLHRLHIMIKIREHQQQHYAWHDEGAVRSPRASGLTWQQAYLDKTNIKRGFLNQLNLIKRSRFLPRNSLLDLYFKVILSSAKYALPIWGCCRNKNEFNFLESIHCRGARVIYSLPRNMPSEGVRKTS